MKASLVRSAVALPLFFTACALFSACSAPHTASDSAETALASPACASQSSALDAALAAEPSAASYDSLLALESESCGASFHTAGPSALGSDRLVRIGSITKTYIAIATLQLVAEGKLGLDDLLSSRLPSVPPAFGPITIRQTLQHTSGVFNYTELGAFWTAFAAEPHRELSPAELLAFAAGSAPYFAPGAGWHYSNTNFILLGMLLEHVEGAPVASILRRRILTPNHLDHTFLEGSEPVLGELAPGFAEDGSEISQSYGVSWAWAAGAMVATPGDTARFITLVGTGALLPPAIQTELTRGVDTGVPAFRYGLGVMLLTTEAAAGYGHSIGHGGDIMGFHSMATYFPERKTALFSAVNSDRGYGSAPAITALRILNPGPAAPPAARFLEPLRGERL